MSVLDTTCRECRQLRPFAGLESLDLFDEAIVLMEIRSSGPRDPRLYYRIY
jgi:hypothetical protein